MSYFRVRQGSTRYSLPIHYSPESTLSSTYRYGICHNNSCLHRHSVSLGHLGCKPLRHVCLLHHRAGPSTYRCSSDSGDAKDSESILKLSRCNLLSPLCRCATSALRRAETRADLETARSG